MNEPFTIIENRDHASWLKARTYGIGGSDASAIVGKNPYKTNIDLFEEKIGRKIPEDISDKPYVRFGTLAEPHIRAIFALTYEWLDEQNELESRTRYWKGKELDTYGITQKQRQMETAMRAQRSKIAGLKSGGVDTDEITIEKARYQAQLYEYATFCNKMGVKQQRERIYMDMNGRLATNTKEQNRKYTPEMFRNAGRDSIQYKHYKNILGDDIGSLEKFRQMKYNEPEKFSILKKKVDTYSEIDKKEWSSEFKQKSKDAYVRFEKEGIYLSVHALSRLPRLNKPGYPSIEETDVLAIVKGNHKYLEGESKLIFFDEKCQLVVAKNKNTDDIVSIIRRKKPKEEWESV